MNVLEVVQGLGRGGAERALLGRLANMPANVTTTLLNLRPGLDAIADPAGIEVLRPSKGETWADDLLDSGGSSRPDVIVMRTPRDALNFTRNLRPAWRGIPLVFEAHSTLVSPHRVLDLWARGAMKRANRWIDLHLAVSEAVAEGPQCQGANEVIVHRLGVDVQTDATPFLPAISGTRFIVLGRLHAVKRPMWIANVVQHLATTFRESASELVFVGAGPEASSLEEFVLRHSLEDVIKVAGEVDEPSAALASADVLIQGSRMEGLPLSIVEAKRMGLRVVTTPAGGSSEVLSTEDTVTAGFRSAEFAEALKTEMKRGTQTMDARRATQQEYSGFTQEASSTQFYEILERRFSRKRVSEFVTGPIKGGIPITIRSRLTNATSPPLTEIIAPFAKTSEDLASPESFSCDVALCPSGMPGIKIMIAQLRGLRPQVVIAHGERELLFASLAGRRARNNARLVFVIHNDRIESRSWVRPFSKMITQFLARRVDVAIAVSAVAARGELGSLFMAPTIAVQPPRNPRSREPREIAGGYRFIAAGRMVPRKGFAVLLSAIGANAQIFAESDSRVTIAGDGPSLNDLQDQAVALGIDRFVDFPGSIPQLAEELRASHYFLQPSESEGAGMALLEALQCGARAASGPVGIAPEALALDPRNTLFKTVPTKSDWIQWFTDTFAIQPPTLDERIARARTYQTAYDSTVLADRFYQVIFGGN